MKRFVIAAAAILLLASCAKTEDPRTIRGVAPEIKPYLDFYIQVKGKSLNYDIPIQFADFTSSPYIGLCVSWSHGYRQITINKEYWDLANDTLRIALLFHELGHCDLNRQHDDSLRLNGWPTSLMNSYNFQYLPEDEAYYFDELF